MSTADVRPPAGGWAGVTGIALSAVLVVVLVSTLDLEAVGAALAAAKPWPLLLATAVYAALFPLRGMRWSLLLKPLAEVPVPLATRAFLVGFMANNVLPARLGDVVRALVLARRAEVPRSSTFATVMLEKVFDGLIVVGFLTLASAALETREMGPVAAFMGAVFGGALLTCIALTAAEDATMALAERIGRPLPEGLQEKVLGTLRKLASGLHVLRDPRTSAGVLGLSLVIWSLEVVVYVGVAAALGIETTYLGLALVMSILTLGLTVPSAPGFVGVFEMLVIPAMGLLGVGAAEAAAFALLLHLIHYVPGTVLGAGAALQTGVGPRDVWR